MKLYEVKIFFPFLFIKFHTNYINSKVLETKNKPEIENCYNSCIHAFLMLISSILYISEYINLEIYKNCLYYSCVYNILDIRTLISYNSRMKNQMIYHILIIVSILIPYLISIP